MEHFIAVESYRTGNCPPAGERYLQQPNHSVAKSELCKHIEPDEFLFLCSHSLVGNSRYPYSSTSNCNYIPPRRQHNFNVVWIEPERDEPVQTTERLFS